MIASGDLRAYLRSLSHQVWNDQSDAIKHGFCLQEETITEMLLLRMARDLSQYGLKMKMFTKTEEGGRSSKGKTVKVGNGADWEWFVELPDCSVGFRVQAKRLMPSLTKPGAYDNFKAGGKQIDQLISAAGQMNPVYVFFNHKIVANGSLFKRSVETNWHGRSSWGCSVATAAFVKTLKTNKLAEVFPGCVPWHRFFAVGNGLRYGCAVDRMIKSMSGIQAFKLAESRPDWVPVLLSDYSREATQEEPPLSQSVELPDYFDTRRERLSVILSKRKLHGVAYIDFTNFEGD